ncbi:MAG: hypothetical protein AB7L91_17895 [Dehalococcoidia bacterium]
MATYFSQRISREQLRQQQENALRVERKEVILEFLKEVQNSWAFLGRVWRGSADLPEDDELERLARAANHEVWFYQRKLELIASRKLRDASLALSERLYSAYFNRPAEEASLWQFISPVQERFLSAARAELGIAREEDLLAPSMRERPASPGAS